MTNYDEINARKLTERQAREAEELDRFLQEMLASDPLEPRRKEARQVLALISERAADFHKWWSDRDFGDTPSRSGASYLDWLEIDDTERLAYRIVPVSYKDPVFCTPEPGCLDCWIDRPKHAGVYLTIDGRLIRYISKGSYWYNYWEDKDAEFPCEQRTFQSYIEDEITDYDDRTRLERLKTAEQLVWKVLRELDTGVYQR
jgi:hypothetical protein